MGVVGPNHALQRTRPHGAIPGLESPCGRAAELGRSAAEVAGVDESDRLGIDLDFWDDAVGAFEPAKVIRQLRRAFPEADVDSTDHQQVRLVRELDAWSRHVPDPSQRETMARQSWGLYRTNGPMYRFVVPLPSGHRVGGAARRLSVCFWVPRGVPEEYSARLVAFLRSLRMGEPKVGHGSEGEAAEPCAAADPAAGGGSGGGVPGRPGR